jgi:hypothetical protein
VGTLVIAGVVGSGPAASQPLSSHAHAGARVEAQTSTSCVDISGTWHTFQGNAGALTFTFHQSGTDVTGTATNGLSLHGTLTGHVIGHHLDVIVTWNAKRSDGSTLQGEYEATIGNGTLTGSTHDVTTPANRTTWTATGGPTKPCVFTPVKINISFIASKVVTAPPKSRGLGVPSNQECPLSRETAKADGHIEAQITPDGRQVGTGYVHDDPYDRRCHNPRIAFKVDRISIAITQPSHIIHATLYVHIDAEALHQRGQCRVGTTGIVQATYNDTKPGANGLNEDDALRIGPWGGGGCNAHVHLITDDQSTDQSTWVRAEIACLGTGANGTSTGYSPRNCGA